MFKGEIRLVIEAGSQEMANNLVESLALTTAEFFRGEGPVDVSVTPRIYSIYLVDENGHEPEPEPEVEHVTANPFIGRDRRGDPKT